LGFDKERDGDRRRNSASSSDSLNGDAPRPVSRRGATPEVGQALRAAYQQTMNEDIPPEMLDLLGKLG
jgi:hypothetical protein